MVAVQTSQMDLIDLELKHSMLLFTPTLLWKGRLVLCLLGTFSYIGGVTYKPNDNDVLATFAYKFGTHFLIICLSGMALG